MSEGLFSIFGDRFTTQAVQNVVRQPLTNNENIGKTIKSVSTGPLKPNEPLKKAGEVKKSFLSNKGTALRDLQTPQKPLTPRSKNIEIVKNQLCSPFIYNDENENNENMQKHFEMAEFTRPRYKYDNYHLDVMDFILEEPKLLKHGSPPTTPPPKLSTHTLECNDSFNDDDFLRDDLADNGYPALFEDDDLPELY